MLKHIENNITPNEIVKCVEGSFAVEGLFLTKQAKENLAKLAAGQSDSEKLILDLTVKYRKKGVNRV